MALDLTAQSTKEFVLERIKDAIEYDDQQAAGEVLKIFREEMVGQLSRVEADPELYNLYRQSWITAQFIKLSSIPEDEFFDLIKEHLIDGLKLKDYDIVEKIGLRISFIQIEEDQVVFMENLLEIIQKNSGVLGSNNLKLGGRTVLPTIANWLLDYDNYPSQSAQKSDYEQIAYLSKSPNVAALSDEEKRILMDILDCYDSLRNLLAYYKKLPEVEDDEIKPEDLHLYYPGAIFVDDLESNGPAGPVESSTKTGAETVKPVPAVVPKIETPAPKYQPPLEPKPAVKQDSYVLEKTEPKPEPAKSVAEQVKEAVEKNEYKAPARPLLNIQDFLNERHNKNNNRGGLVFDAAAVPVSGSHQSEKPKVPLTSKSEPTPTNPKVSTEPALPKVPENLPVKAELARASATQPSAVSNQSGKTEEIAKKLEELRKRKKT